MLTVWRPRAQGLAGVGGCARRAITFAVSSVLLGHGDWRQRLQLARARQHGALGLEQLERALVQLHVQRIEPPAFAHAAAYARVHGCGAPRAPRARRLVFFLHPVLLLTAAPQ